MTMCSVNPICPRPRTPLVELPRPQANAAHAVGGLSKCAAMKKIKLLGGKSATVDDCDYERLLENTWYVSKGYAVGCQKREGKWVRIAMHRLVAGTPDGMETDHINGNKLDNRRENLRICTHAENLRNRMPIKGGIKGVNRNWNKFRARIRVNGVSIHLGNYPSEYEAAMAYDTAAIKYHGEFAATNYNNKRKYT